MTTLRSRWLFRGVNNDIARAVIVRAGVSVPPEKPAAVTALLMPVATADTNGDGTVSPADDHALYVYRVGGGAPVKVIDAKSISDIVQLDSDRVMVEYFDGAQERIALLSTKGFKPLAQSAVPTTP